MPSIATNTTANSVLLYLNKNQASQQTSLERISSGSRINNAKDDASGLAISTQIQSDITTLEQASINAQNGQSVLETMDGALSKVADILQRMKALAAQGVSGINNATAYTSIDSEYQALQDELDAIDAQTNFNGVSLFGGYNNNFLVGTDATSTIGVNLTQNVDSTSLALTATITDNASSVTAMGTIDTAIDTVSGYRADVGALSSRFSYRADVVDTTLTNLEASYSSIADADLAAEQTAFTNAQTLTEAAIAALAQANNMNSSLLSLVK